MPRYRSRTFAALVAAASLAATSLAVAQDWPTRPISMVVPFGAGSASDTVGRIVAISMSQTLGQQVIVENVGGAGGMTGSARVVHAPPDGYMFSFGSTDTIAINQTLYKKPLYNAATDFTPVTLVVDQPMVLIVRAGLPVNTLAEFIAYAKANQSKMQFGSSGVGSSSHLGCTRVNLALGITPQHIPYRGSGQAMQDLAGGRIDYFCALGAAAVGPLANKTAKAIALLAHERSPLFPDVPSSEEQGLKGVDTYFWSAFLYPKGTPAPIVQKLQMATSKALDDPAIQARLKTAGVVPVPPERRTPEFLAKFTVDEIAAWAKTIKAAGVSID
jgi:tripartite-type tricarboxylate transporter receptor subunit TctC